MFSARALVRARALERVGASGRLRPFHRRAAARSSASRTRAIRDLSALSRQRGPLLQPATSAASLPLTEASQSSQVRLEAVARPAQAMLMPEAPTPMPPEKTRRVVKLPLDPRRSSAPSVTSVPSPKHRFRPQLNSAQSLPCWSVSRVRPAQAQLREPRHLWLAVQAVSASSMRVAGWPFARPPSTRDEAAPAPEALVVPRPSGAEHQNCAWDPSSPWAGGHCRCSEATCPWPLARGTP